MIKFITFAIAGVFVGIFSEKLFASMKARSAASRGNNKFKKEIIESWSYMEDPSGMDKDIKDLLDQENSKNQKKSIDSHPAKDLNIEYGHLSGYLEEQIKKSENKKSAPAADQNIYLKFWR